MDIVSAYDQQAPCVRHHPIFNVLPYPDSLRAHRPPRVDVSPYYTPSHLSSAACPWPSIKNSLLPEDAVYSPLRSQPHFRTSQSHPSSSISCCCWHGSNGPTCSSTGSLQTPIQSLPGTRPVSLSESPPWQTPPSKALCTAC